MTNILAKIVQNEVGGGLGLTGADKLKLYTAQAVAANSWLQYQYAHGITAPEVGLKTVTDSSIYTAVEEAQKYVVTYNGEPPAPCTEAQRYHDQFFRAHGMGRTPLPRLRKKQV